MQTDRKENQFGGEEEKLSASSLEVILELLYKWTRPIIVFGNGGANVQWREVRESYIENVIIEAL